MESNADIREILGSLVGGHSLCESDARALFERMLRGELDEAQISGVLSLMQSRGVTLEELVGAARVMRRHVIAVPVPDDGVPTIDTCGTGGAPKTFNVSTAAAIVAAGSAPGRLRVAKHGNRSRTGRGSAEVLAALGVHVDASPQVQARCLQEAGVCFCFAIHHHPASRHAAAVRKSLGFPTIFNLLGPLANPAGASRQLMGIYSGDLQGLMAEALGRLGSERAMVVYSEDGLDEIAISAPTTAIHVRDGQTTTETIDPRDLGMDLASIQSVRVSSVEQSAQMILRVLEGKSGSPADFTLLNAGAALVVGGVVETLGEGIEQAREGIRRGNALRALQTLREVSGLDA